MTKATTQGGIQIYVACLAAYNNGHLHGTWIDAEQDSDDIQADIAKMLAASPIPDAPEWAIHDYEGFEGVRLSEYQGIEHVAELAAFIAEHGSVGAEILSHHCGEMGEARKALEEQYSGCYASLADYAEQITTECNGVPDHLAFYIDYERMGRDMELGGDIYTVTTAHDEVHVFWG